MVWRIPDGVLCALRGLEAAGYAAYLVGGCVRDLLLDRTPGDYDVATAALPEQVQALFAHTAPTGLRHGTVTVLTADGPVEVTTFRRESLYSDGRHPDRVEFVPELSADLARRDFTINAMALARDETLYDPFDGRTDLKRRSIRCVGEPDRRFAEDALRMLRGVRFSAQLGFSIAPETYGAMGRNAWRMARISGERVKVELEKILLSPAPERAGELLALGLLAHLCPSAQTADLTALRALPATPAARWHGFCTLTGFPITALPVERALRRAVLHPELEVMRSLAVSGGELMALGLRGAEIGKAQRMLADHVRAHPGDNRRARLLALLQEEEKRDGR